MKITESTLDVLLGKIRLREGDEEEDGEEEGAAGPDFEETIPERADETDKPTEQIPLEDDISEPEDEKEAEVIGEGQIPQDTSGVTEGNFEALKPHGVVEVDFEQGNWNSIADMGQVVADKVQMITKTVEPLCEKALIELLGSSSMFRRVSANVTSGTGSDGQVQFTGVFQYQCSFWIGLNVKKEAIDHDAKYVYDTLSPISDTVQITKCAIDVKDGTLTVGFTL